MAPEDIYEELHRYRRMWDPRRLGFLSRQVIETEGDTSHPHFQALQRLFLEYHHIFQFTIPTSYPTNQVHFKLAQQQLDHKSGVYLNAMAAAKAVKQRQIQLRQATSAMVRKMVSNLAQATRITVRPGIVYQAQTTGTEVPALLTKAAQTEENVTVGTSDACTQASIGRPRGKQAHLPVDFEQQMATNKCTTMLTSLRVESIHETQGVEDDTMGRSKERHQTTGESEPSSEEERMQHELWVNTKTQSIKGFGRPAPAVFQSYVDYSKVPEQTAALKPNVSLLRYKQSETPLYRTKIDGNTCLVTKEEMKRLHPQQKHFKSANVADNQAAVFNIRMRISKRFRTYTNRRLLIARRKRMGRAWPPTLPRPNNSGTMKALIAHFHDKVVTEGNKALPQEYPGTDPENSDDEFFEKVLKLTAKPNTKPARKKGTSERVKRSVTIVRENIQENRETETQVTARAKKRKARRSRYEQEYKECSVVISPLKATVQKKCQVQKPKRYRDSDSE